MRDCVNSLIATAPNAEIFVIDNGGSLEDSRWLLERNESGEIACYIRNRKNMSFHYARNQAMKICTGDYIAISDNDILYKEGWLEDCIGFLERNPGNYLATSIPADPMNAIRLVRWKGEVDGWRLNYRAGSNSFVMRRSDFEKIGFFEAIKVSGSKYVDRYNRLGYTMAINPEQKAYDMGFRNGYNVYEEIKHRDL